MKKNRFQETSMEITVGAFMFMILLALGFFTIVLSRENLFKKTYTMEVTFQSVMGLREGDNVFVRGVDIGNIKTIQLEDDGVHILATLNRALVMHKDYRIEILASSVLGGKYLNVYEGSPEQPDLPPDTALVGTTPVDLIDEATRTIQSVESALNEGGILTNLEVIARQVRTVTAQISEGKGTLGRLIMEDGVYEDLDGIAKNLKAISVQLAEGQGTLGKLIADDAVYTNLYAISDNLRVVSDNLAEGKGTLGKLLSSDDALYTNLLSASESINEVAGTIAAGRGTLGRLVQDDEVYDEIKMLLSELRATLDDLREASPVTTFSSVFFGAF